MDLHTKIDVVSLNKRIKELEQEVENWKDQAMSELHDLNMCREENGRLRGALREIIDASGMRDCNDEVAEIAQKALEE